LPAFVSLPAVCAHDDLTALPPNIPTLVSTTGCLPLVARSRLSKASLQRSADQGVIHADNDPGATEDNPARPEAPPADCAEYTVSTGPRRQPSPCACQCDQLALAARPAPLETLRHEPSPIVRHARSIDHLDQASTSAVGEPSGIAADMARLIHRSGAPEPRRPTSQMNRY
jgi:hypothetical protein